MIDRLSALIIGITLLAIGVVIAAAYGDNAISITILTAMGLIASILLYGSHSEVVYEPAIHGHSVHGQALLQQSILRHPQFAKWADQEAEPVIGISDGVVTIANDAAITLLGRHIIGADIRTAIRHPAAAELFDRALAKAVTAGDAPSPPVSLFDYPRTGQHWTIRLTGISRSDAIVFLNDHSALDAADRMRSDFVANASHELRTPLAAILGYVETLQDMGDESGPMRGRFLGIIDREAKRMQQLVLDLLSISRVEADRFRRPNTVVNLANIVTSTISQIQDSAQSRPADIVANIAETPMRVMGDVVQLSQLTHNIIGNAIKYGRAGTAIHVSLAQVGRQAVLKIRDHGDGIAAQHIPRLTERFYRVDDARSRSVGGTGLGLSIVKHIAERHQGNLSIESVVGQGTVVTVSFPLVDDSAAVR